jgi:outer membrane immunogenic protein
MPIIARIGFIAIALTVFAAPNAAAQDILRSLYSPIPVANWTGFYVGANAGYGWVERDATASSSLGSAVGTSKMKGMIAGGQLGVNVQFSGPWVIGIETDFQKSWQKLSGRGITSLLYNAVGIANPAINETDDIDWFGTTRIRFGVAPERILFFGTAGVAYASIRTRATSGAGASLIDGTPTRIGWTFGGGIEAMLTRNWTARAEYLRLDFGGYTERWLYAGTTTVTLHQRVTDDIVRAGVNYYFR